MHNINDEYIISLFYGKRQINSLQLKKYYNGTLDKEICKYLETRFDDSKSIKETLYRIKYKIETRPVCPICGKEVDFIGKKDKGFNTHCSCVCTQKDSEVRKKYKETCTHLYGEDNPAKSNIVKEKIKQTNIQRYGVDNVYKSDIIKERIKNTLLERYGVENIHNAPHIVKYWKEHEREIVSKRNKTKLKNHTFNTSKPENECYLFLKNKFNIVKRQYKSREYPFFCDFYIEDINLYIELNSHWTHGPHPFDSNSIEDNNLLNYWKSKNNQFYNNAIKTWVINDVKKRNKAKENNLNFLEFWSKNDLYDYFNNN